MDYDSRSLSNENLLQINRLCNDFEAACQAGSSPHAESWMEKLPAELRFAALSELLLLEIEYRQQAGDIVAVEELTDRFPDSPRDWLQQLIDHSRSRADGNDSPTIVATPAERQLPEQLGDYRLLARIGAGGMGTVYKAVHQRMGRVVALKVLRPEIQNDPRFAQRFDREVRAAARLMHPHIVAALDAREENGIYYLITEFVDGCDLDETVRRHGPLSVAEAVDCIVQAARGLEYAHRQGVVHRDIKPANILRDNNGVVKILDMGLARIDEIEDTDAANLTKFGMIMGTAAYMAPEQARNTHRSDSRSDIYSLGCTLHFLLTGRPVFIGETAVDTILSHASQPIPALCINHAVIPRGLESVFRRMVAKSPNDRFQTATELLAALEPFTNRMPSPTLETSPATVVIGQHSTWSAASLEKIPNQNDALPATVNRAALSRRSVRGLIAVVALIGLLVLGRIAAQHSARPEVDTRSGQFALEFDGQSSYLAVRNLEPTADATYTIELFAQPHSEPSSQPANLISWLGPNWMAIYLDGRQRWGVARLWQGQSRLIATRTPATLGQKVHVAGVFDGSDLRIFVNGKPIATDIVKFPLPETSGGLFIGGADPARLPDERPFKGLIHSVRISRGVRYADEFIPPSQLVADTDTLAVFPFAEGHSQATRSSDGTWTAEIVNAIWQRQGA